MLTNVYFTKEIKSLQNAMVRTITFHKTVSRCVISYFKESSNYSGENHKIDLQFIRKYCLTLFTETLCPHSLLFRSFSHVYISKSSN